MTSKLILQNHHIFVNFNIKEYLIKNQISPDYSMSIDFGPAHQFFFN